MISQEFLVGGAAVGLLLVLGALMARLPKAEGGLLERPVVFFALVGACLLVVRWPQINSPQEINVDESQFLAQAMRFCSHPVPWRDVDGTTSGPLNSLFLSGPMLFGAPEGWRLARIMLWAANCLTVGFLYLGLRRFGSRGEAQFVLIPTILFYAFGLAPDFNHYSSETLPALLLAAGWCLLAWEWTAQKSSGARLFALGLVAGSIPFTKLQAGPLAAFLVLVGLGQLVAKGRAAKQTAANWWPRAAMLCGGALVVPAAILGVVAATGAFPDFWTSYILASGAYAGEALGSKWHIWRALFTKPDFAPYALCALVMLAFLLGVAFRGGASRRGKWFWPLAAVAANGGLTALCVAAPGKAFAHYLALLVPPMALFMGLAFLAVKDRLTVANGAGSKVPGNFPPLLKAAVVLMVLPMLWQPVRYVAGIKAAFPAEELPKVSAIAGKIREASRPGDTLSIWGWMPSYYVETGLAPATRDAIGHYVVTAGPYQDFFRARFLADFQRSRPALFVDAVADGAFCWWSWKRSDVLEGFPGLAAYVNENYALWWSIYLKDDGLPVRIYVRNDRMAELKLSPGNAATLVVSNSPSGQ
jgi:hypothetical protein